MPEPPRPEPGTKLRPEPRQLPERPPTPPIAPRYSTDDDVLKRRHVPASKKSRGERRRLMARLTLPAAFVVGIGATVGLSLYFFLPDGPGKMLTDASKPLDVPPIQPEVSPGDTLPPAPPPPVDEIGELLNAVTELPPLPEPLATEEPEPAGLAAERVLEAFLSSTDAESRAPLVDPPASLEELSSGIFATPFPPVGRIEGESPRFFESENVTEFPFSVTFQPADGKSFKLAVLVRRVGEQSPKILLPAFLDLMPGGRLQEFCAAPAPARKVADFRVVLQARSGCFDESVPAAEKKFTFRLLPESLSQEIAKAYATDSTRFREILDDPESRLRWGTRVRATVALRWNHEEDPSRPYLELLSIKALEWSP